MKVIIIAAGYGKRLHPLTNSCPKPLLKINGETLLSNTFNFLIKFGVTEAVVNVHYLSEKIVEYISKNKFNLSITIINE